MDMDASIPSETQYADDLDFISSSGEHLEHIFSALMRDLPEWNLQANESKTERVHAHTHTEADTRGHEPWRGRKTLGSLLDCGADIKRRKCLGAVVFHKMQSLWGRQKFPLWLKVKLYNVYVKPVPLYNSGTWGPTKTVMENFDAFHRSHLRRMARISYPQRIRNKKLYQMCGAIPLSREIAQTR